VAHRCGHHDNGLSGGPQPSQVTPLRSVPHGLRALDRFSRDQEDTAGFFKRLTFASVNIVTPAEGDITHLRVGLKGTMNALFLKDLADKTRRGLRGRVELGKSGGGLCYGYKVTRAGHQGEMTTGDREIVTTEAEVIRRIFRDYAAGVSPKALAKRLNAEPCPGPGGKPWNPSTIHGNPARGTGILNNELYLGRLVWNRLRYVKDPDTGRRVSRPNPPSQWVTTDVPHLRIVDDELWNQVKARQAVMRRITAKGDPKQFNWARRPKYLFSGLTKCAECGGGYVMYWRDRLACFGARSRGTCSNRLTISRQEVEQRVLVALRDKLMRRDLFEDFCREYVGELNRLRMEHRASLSNGRRELARSNAKSGSSFRRSRTACQHSPSRTSSSHSKPGKPNCSHVSKPRRCRSCCTRACPTSIARRLAASVWRWRARRAARAPKRPSEC
jgi:site-specific DNA recombinase